MLHYNAVTGAFIEGLQFMSQISIIDGSKSSDSSFLGFTGFDNSNHYLYMIVNVSNFN